MTILHRTPNILETYVHAQASNICLSWHEVAVLCVKEWEDDKGSALIYLNHTLFSEGAEQNSKKIIGLGRKKSGHSIFYFMLYLHSIVWSYDWKQFQVWDESMNDHACLGRCADSILGSNWHKATMPYRSCMLQNVFQRSNLAPVQHSFKEFSDLEKAHLRFVYPSLR